MGLDIETLDATQKMLRRAEGKEEKSGLLEERRVLLSVSVEFESTCNAPSLQFATVQEVNVAVELEEPIIDLFHKQYVPREEDVVKESEEKEETVMGVSTNVHNSNWQMPVIIFIHFGNPSSQVMLMNVEELNITGVWVVKRLKRVGELVEEMLEKVHSTKLDVNAVSKVKSLSM